jgi:hypothetical protein
MARRSLSTRGRILAAGVSVAVGGALVGLMATGDHRATATPTNSSANSSVNSSVSGSSDDGTAVPYDGRAYPGDVGPGSGSQPQSQTRTGGS